MKEILEVSENVEEMMRRIKEDRIEVMPIELENYCSETSQDLYIFFAVPSISKSGLTDDVIYELPPLQLACWPSNNIIISS